MEKKGRGRGGEIRREEEEAERTILIQSCIDISYDL